MLPNESPNRMRIQLQEGSINTHSKVIEASSDQGVTPRQLREKMIELYRTVPDEAYWYPWNRPVARKYLGHAISLMSRKIKKYAESGTDASEVGNIERVEWVDRGRQFRIDLENLDGVNLKIKR